MITTLKTLEGFVAKAAELGFEFPKGERYEIPTQYLTGNSGRRSGRSKQNFKQKDKLGRYWEFRMRKDQPDGSHMVMSGVFNIKTQQAIEIEIGHLNSSQNGFRLEPQQKDWLPFAGKIKVVYGKVDFDIHPDHRTQDEFGPIIVDLVTHNETKWHRPEVFLINPRR